MKFIDLSIPIINPDELIFDPEMMELNIEYNNHDQGAEDMGEIFKLQPEIHLPIGKGWASERITLSTHNGTHMDAPWHFAPI
ncbi:MAG: cyclase family protein, partial [Candidatus Hodarchaeota archaeon]